MIITPEFRQAVAEANGAPLRLEDPETREVYLITKEAKAAPLPPIPEGLRLADEAFRRELPAMLADRKLKGKYVLYHRDKRIAVGKRGYELAEKALQMKLSNAEYVVFCVEPEDEELAPVYL